MEKRSFVMKLAVRFAVLFFLFPALLCLSADLESGTALFDYVGGDTPIVTNAWLNVSNSTHSLIEKIVAENVPTNIEIDTSSFVTKNYEQSGVEYNEDGSPYDTYDNGSFSWTFGIAEMYQPDLIDKVKVSLSTNGIVITGDTPKDGNPLNYISFERPNGDKTYLGDELANAGSVQSVNNVQPVNGNVHLEPDDIGALGVNGIADRARIAESVDWLDVTTKPDWVDSRTKPSYNANEVGAYTKGEVDAKVNSVSNIAVNAKEGLDKKRDKSDLKYELPEYADFISSYGHVFSYNAKRTAEYGRPIWIDEQNDSISYHGNNLWKWNAYAECVASEDALSLDFGDFGSYSRQSVFNPVQETKLATLLDLEGVKGDIATAGKVQSVNSKTGEVVITASDLGDVVNNQLNVKFGTDDEETQGNASLNVGDGIGKGIVTIGGDIGELNVGNEIGSINVATSGGYAEVNIGSISYPEDAILMVGGVNVMTELESKADASAVNDVRNTVNQWTTYWDGDDVRVTVTNYYGSMALPSLYLEQRMPADETHDNVWFKIVWNEMTRWNQFLSEYQSLSNEVSQKADRAWGYYDSSTGEYSPDGYLQVSTPNIIVANGLSYQKTVSTGGFSMWVLTATQPMTISGETEQGFFKISDGDGNALFEIVKGDKRVVGATATAVSVNDGAMRITYNVTGEHPTISLCSNLGGEWQTGDEITMATVVWSGSSGEWIATVTPSGPYTSMFAKASYEAGGNTYIKNHVASSLDKVVVGGIEYTVTVETINGKKMLVLQ